jgi:hypothetical protein
LSLEDVIATQASVFVQRVFAGKRDAVNGVAGPSPAGPSDTVGDQKATDAAVPWLNLQARLRAESNAVGIVVDPNVQMILFFTYSLSGQLNVQAQQTELFAMAFRPSELHKTQGPCASDAVGREGRKTQHLEMIGLDICPRQKRRLSLSLRSISIAFSFSVEWGLSIGHVGNLVARYPAANLVPVMSYRPFLSRL